MAVIADIHGNDVALRAVVKDAERMGVDTWWVLGDLVLFGPRPAEVLDLLSGLPNVHMLRGNTDRYVVTGEQPAPHATAADAAVNIELVERYGAMAAGIGWTRGVLDQAGSLDVLIDLPHQLRTELPSGPRLLGVHASTSADDGQGIEPDVSEQELSPLLTGCDADVVVGGHTHMATDRQIGSVHALNPGAVGIPRECGEAGWLLLEDDGSSLLISHHKVIFDVQAVVGDLRRRKHPNAHFVTSILTGERPQSKAR